MTGLRRALLAVWIGLAASVGATADEEEGYEATFDRIRDEVLPSKDEERWREVPWRPSVWDAVVEAAQTDRPVLVWAMNGHPLGCT
jgi:hypothetical protein